MVAVIMPSFREYILGFHTVHTRASLLFAKAKRLQLITEVPHGVSIKFVQIYKNLEQ